MLKLDNAALKLMKLVSAQQMNVLVLMAALTVAVETVAVEEATTAVAEVAMAVVMIMVVTTNQIP